MIKISELESNAKDSSFIPRILEIHPAEFEQIRQQITTQYKSAHQIAESLEFTERELLGAFLLYDTKSDSTIALFRKHKKEEVSKEDIIKVVIIMSYIAQIGFPELKKQIIMGRKLLDVEGDYKQ